MNEKIGGAEGTKLDDDFVEMEKVSLLPTQRMKLTDSVLDGVVDQTIKLSTFPENRYNLRISG